MPTLEDAIALALEAHRGQRDKAGAPYIRHPLRVTFEDLRARGYSETVLAALDGLTRREDESYLAFVRRARANPIARQVKLADIEDNMDLRRLVTLGQRDVERLRRYREAWALLREAA